MKSRYEQWADAEKKKINDKYEAKRQEVNGAIFLEGFSSDGISGRNRKKEQEYSDRLKEIDRQEQEEIAEFIRTIESK